MAETVGVGSPSVRTITIGVATERDGLSVAVSGAVSKGTRRVGVPNRSRSWCRSGCVIYARSRGCSLDDLR